MISPVLHRILVKPFDLVEVDKDYARAQAAGIYLDFSEKDREQAAVDKGTIVAIGSTAFKDFGTDSPVVVGDTVIFAKYGGKVVKDEGVSYTLLNDEDVLAIISKEPLDG